METTNNASSWRQLTENKPFISDLGESQSAEINGVPTHIGRYAVWSPIHNSQNHQVVEIGDDVKILAEKYKIPPQRVFTLIREEGESHG